jgi:hypothetical protein
LHHLSIGGSSGQLVEKEINGDNPAVPRNDEISPGVSRRLTRAARYPLDPPAIAQFVRFGNWLILKKSSKAIPLSRVFPGDAFLWLFLAIYPVQSRERVSTAYTANGHALHQRDVCCVGQFG